MNLATSFDLPLMDHRKPDGLLVITPKMGPPFVEILPIFHISTALRVIELRLFPVGIASSHRGGIRAPGAIETPFFSLRLGSRHFLRFRDDQKTSLPKFHAAEMAG
jgi:hypothetical protein